MAKLVIIHVNGDFGNGFTIYLQIFTEDDRQLIGTARGKLPPAKDLYDNYTLWRSPYSNYISGRNSGRISVYGGTETSIINEIKQASKQLKLSLNDWLKQDSQFIAIREKLFQNLKDESEEIRVIFETENIELQRLPWHLWDDFFKHYHRSEVVLSLPVKKLQIISDTKQVKVLAVFGTRETLSNATRIKTEKDWEMLERLLSKDSNACLIKLEQPSLDYLCEQIDEHKPQILFFAGHSRSEENGVSGYIDLNDEEIITIDDLEPDLRRAVKRGLQLAIFNSCDGLGIARQLANLHVPNIIVMREPVPDEVAQKFLQRFLEAFAAGKSLHLALRRARERINRLENRFPGATWLPVTFQNPAEPPLTWRSLGGVEIRKQSNQTGVAGKESQIENQASIAWLLTTPDLNQIKSQQTIVTSNSSETQIQSTTLGINAKSSKVENFDEQLINCDNCNHLNPPRAILCEMCYIPLTLAKKSKKEAELSPLPLTNELENKESENKESKKEAELSKGVSSNQKQKSYYGSISGHKLRGRYQIVQQLGLGGGFGATYIACDTDRPGNPKCLVKQLKPRTNDPNTLQIAQRFFKQEAEIQEELGNHDQIPRLLAYFEENQEFYLVQEFIEGHDLRQELPPLANRLTEVETIKLLTEILEVLAFVHRQGVIHRDIKPANIMRRQDGKIVLIDFGAVKKVRGLEVNQQGQTVTVAIGTLGYMPSEQAAGEPQYSSDVYAVGVIGIQALTGIYPDPSQGSKLPRDPQTGEIVWRDQVRVSPELANILDRMVRCHFGGRYQSATEALSALQSLAPPATITKFFNMLTKLFHI